MEEVDKVIIAICERIQKDLDSSESTEELIKALAELLSARARIEWGY